MQAAAIIFETPVKRDLNQFEKLVDGYDRRVLLRLVVQAIPGGSTVDAVIAGKASQLSQERFDELVSHVSTELEHLDKQKLDIKFLASEEFFEIFRSTAEIVARTVNKEKRRILGDYLAGVAQLSTIGDLEAQVLEDLRNLQPLHLIVLASLPKGAGKPIQNSAPPELGHLEKGAYAKAISDLERFGFIRYDTINIGVIGSSGGIWSTTEYQDIFWQRVTRPTDGKE